MSQQPTTNPAGGVRARVPWSPLAISFITLFLPAGGVVLTIRNMERLGEVEARTAARLVWSAMGVLTLGYAFLTFTAPRSDGIPRLDSNMAALLSIALAAFAYLALRKPFAAWRERSAQRPGSLLPAVVTALLYEVIVIVGVVILVVLLGPLAGINTLQMHA